MKEEIKMEPFEKEHLDLVMDSAAECTVLLKCNGDFPLKEAGKIAAFGNGVRRTIKGGTGSGEVYSRFSVNIEQGLADAGFEVTSGDWLDGYDQIYADGKKKFVKEIRSQAKAAGIRPMHFAMGKIMKEPEYKLKLKGKGDVAIYVVARNSGEGADREAASGDIFLTDTEIRDILELHKKYKKFMLVLNVGGVIDLSPVMEVENILLLSQLGVVTGTILAEILLGKKNPSGKLATTWSRWEDYCDIGEFGCVDETRYQEGIYVGYRYFDSVGKKALFPFGYGQSYTTFSIKDAFVTVEKDLVTVEALVENTGNCAGKEVVQVYVSTPQGKLDKPYQDLAAFAKTKELAPGESDRVTATFSMRDLASYDEEAASYILEKGSYFVRVGNSSVDTKVAAILAINETLVTLKAKNVLGKPDFEDWKPEYVPDEVLIRASTKILGIAKADIETKEVCYDVEHPVDPVIEALTDEELAMMSVGDFDPKAKGHETIGNASRSVPGAAGETPAHLKEKGVKSLVMADGPSGLRLTPLYYEDAKGKHGIGNAMIPQGLTDFMGPLEKLKSKLFGGMGSEKTPKNVELKEQYATAIPIGTALAQSFNYDFARACGDIVGAEMEHFGVNLWLAPALNIHRSIRCGRNFEYYSEDPYVSGMMAAALTEGVQSHPGRATTIKHYAANSQETSRFTNNSLVSERALREIYLKGFGICVRKAHPYAVMTSYNLLNGIHTSEHRGLNEEILRNEYGFEDVIMTDWVVEGQARPGSKYRAALVPEVARAGGDLFMPGSKQDYQRILEALKDGSLEREQLRINATRVCRMAEKLLSE